MQKSVLMICDSDLSKEPRVIRQIIALKDDFTLYTLGANPAGFKEVEHYGFVDFTEKPWHWKYPPPVRKIFSVLLGLYEKFKGLYLSHYYKKKYWSRRRREAYKKLKGKKFDVIIAHHWDALPLAFALASVVKAKLVFNAHDYYQRQFEDNKNWALYQQPWVQFIIDRYVPKCDLMFSAWTKIHDDFQRLYKVPSIIINNATEYNELAPQLKEDDEKKIKIIHHGIANSNRKIELMIEVMDHLEERFHLYLMLIESPYEAEYFKKIRGMAESNPRIKFIEPVPTREISKRINEYDIGLFLLPLNGFNLTYLLPNKLFEFIQGRLACLVTPNEEMKVIVEKYDLGWVSDNFEPANVAGKIRNVSNFDINNKKENADKIAFQLSAESNFKKIKEAIKGIIDNEYR